MAQQVYMLPKYLAFRRPLLWVGHCCCWCACLHGNKHTTVHARACFCLLVCLFAWPFATRCAVLRCAVTDVLICSAASQQLVKEKKGWSSLLDDGVSTAQNKTSLPQGIDASRGGLAQSQAVADASQTAHAQSRGGDAMSQEQLRDQFKGLGSLRDESSSQQSSGVIQPETKSLTQQGITQQGLTQQGSDQTEQGITLSQTATSGSANRVDMPYSGSDLAQADLGLSSADASEGTLASTTTQTDSSQTEAKQSQTGATESLGTKTWELESPESLQAQGLPEDWYWVTYLQMNQDVASAVGRDAASAKMHYQKWGKEEGRPYKVCGSTPSIIYALHQFT